MRKKTSEAAQIWKERIERWRSVGGSASAFCEQEDLELSSFYQWRKKLALASVAQDSAFLAVVVDKRPTAGHSELSQLPDARWVADVLARFVRNFEP